MKFFILILKNTYLIDIKVHKADMKRNSKIRTKFPTLLFTMILLKRYQEGEISDSDIYFMV